MTAIGQYAISVFCAAFLTGILSDLAEKFGFHHQIRLICSLFLLFTVLHPLVQINLPDLNSISTRFAEEAESAAAYGENIRVRSLAALIQEEAEAYILKEAKSCGADVAVQIKLGGNNPPTPEAITIQGSFDADAEEYLSIILAEAFGIPKEQQTWIRQEYRNYGSS